MTDDWPSYEKKVLSDLERLEEAVNELKESILAILIDIAVLKVKAGAWGLLGGLIPSMIAVGISLKK